MNNIIILLLLIIKIINNKVNPKGTTNSNEHNEIAKKKVWFGQLFCFSLLNRPKKC